MEQEVIDRIVQTISDFAGELEKEKTRIHEAVNSISLMDEDHTLSIPFLKQTIKQRSDRIFRLNEISKKHEITCQVYLEQGLFTNSQKAKVEHYIYVSNNYKKVTESFFEFVKKYEYYTSKNAEEIKKQVRSILNKRNFVIDGCFEGDFVNWVGVYARPSDKPTYLDAITEKEAELQNKYRDENGFKRDFAEWFEWRIENGQLFEL